VNLDIRFRLRPLSWLHRGLLLDFIPSFVGFGVLTTEGPWCLMRENQKKKDEKYACTRLTLG
jgi:hypothetical protein